MTRYRILALSPLLVGLAACNGTPTNGLLPGSTYQIEQLETVTPKGSPFTQALAADYLVLARYELGWYDWNAQQVFAKKGLAAADGMAVAPERLEDWSIDDPSAERDLRKARARLMSMLAGDAPSRAPRSSATAQTSFDCWIHEQHEGWETERIAECRSTFMRSLAQLDIRPGPAPSESEAQPAPVRSPPSRYIVFFDFDKADLMADARRIIASAAKQIAAGGTVKITGYTDTSGTAAYNQRLSLRRAASVENELVRDGVPAAAITVDGRGESDLLTPTPDGVREPQNRRATIELITP